MESLSMKVFLESVPPGTEVVVENLAPGITPEIDLHCEVCLGPRIFKSIIHVEVAKILQDVFLDYECKNCQRVGKTFAIRCLLDKKNNNWNVLKYGEYPSFGPPTPSRAVTLIGGEKDLFFLGRRCENQGMGIGAFLYYRRVIESQKNRIFDEVIRVVERISGQDPVLEDLKSAKKETQFTKAVDTIKHALPPSLSINGYNPLTLLHAALSEGVHDHNDSESLELATDIRTVLFELAERLGQALKDEANLNAAVNRLTKEKR